MSSNANSEPKRALVTGITGQDGSYLAELLLSLVGRVKIPEGLSAFHSRL